MSPSGQLAPSAVSSNESAGPRIAAAAPAFSRVTAAPCVDFAVEKDELRTIGVGRRCVRNQHFRCAPRSFVMGSYAAPIQPALAGKGGVLISSIGLNQRRVD